MLKLIVLGDFYFMCWISNDIFDNKARIGQELSQYLRDDF
jgi:hypothetical protein